jgi:hypothetical protein
MDWEYGIERNKRNNINEYVEEMRNMMWRKDLKNVESKLITAQETHRVERHEEDKEILK